jgi:hypothetical protein
MNQRSIPRQISLSHPDAMCKISRMQILGLALIGLPLPRYDPQGSFGYPAQHADRLFTPSLFRGQQPVQFINAVHRFAREADDHVAFPQPGEECRPTGFDRNGHYAGRDGKLVLISQAAWHGNILGLKSQSNCGVPCRGAESGWRRTSPCRCRLQSIFPARRSRSRCSHRLPCRRSRATGRRSCPG